MLSEPVPEDVIATILTHLKDDVPTLKSCNLLSRSVRIHAAKVMFSTLDLRWPRSGLENDEPEDFIRDVRGFLERNTYLENAVQNLRLSAQGEEAVRLRRSPLWTLLPMLLSRFPSLTSLSIHSIAGPNVAPYDIIEVTQWGSFTSRLERIHIHGIWLLWLFQEILNGTKEAGSLRELSLSNALHMHEVQQLVSQMRLANLASNALSNIQEVTIQVGHEPLSPASTSRILRGVSGSLKKLRIEGCRCYSPLHKFIQKFRLESLEQLTSLDLPVRIRIDRFGFGSYIAVARWAQFLHTVGKPNLIEEVVLRVGISKEEKQRVLTLATPSHPVEVNTSRCQGFVISRVHRIPPFEEMTELLGCSSKSSETQPSLSHSPFAQLAVVLSNQDYFPSLMRVILKVFIIGDGKSGNSQSGGLDDEHAVFLIDQLRARFRQAFVASGAYVSVDALPLTDWED